jgi:alkyldihydroxyacetonephosphate synthase
MAAEHGQGLELLRTLQRAVDPAGIMNPGKAGL